MLVPMTSVTLADLPGRPCPIAAALDVVGERWALLIVRELALENSRFRGRRSRHRRAQGPGGGPDQGVGGGRGIQRIPYRAAPPRFDYQLTDSGRALLPVLDALLALGLDHAVRSGDPDRERYRWAKA